MEKLFSLIFPKESVIMAEFFGGWLSLVEHYVRDVGVVGSNPIPPTNKECRIYCGIFYWYGVGFEATRKWGQPRGKGG